MNRNPVSNSTSLARRIALAALLTGAAILWPVSASAVDPASHWNSVAVQAFLTAGQGQIPSSRTLAIVQLAIHDALNAIDSRYERYAYTEDAPPEASVDAATAAAARDAIVGAVAVGAFPGFGSPANQALAVAQVDAAYAAALAAIPDGSSKSDGIAVGQAAASAVLTARSGDGATVPVSYTPGTEPGDWRPTPNPVPFDPPAAADLLPAAFPGWGQVTPFVLLQSNQFEPAGPPRLSKRRYARDYDEVKAIGEKNSSTRTADQTSIARFWYEGSPTGWSRIARVVAETQGLDTWDTARLLALVNLAMADGFIAGFEAKYHFNFWRPVTAIRAGDSDGNKDTVADPAWSTLLNTPAIPDYPSTHSVLGGAAAEVLRRVFDEDDVAFTVTSGAPFAGLTRSYASFSEAARENGESRIYAGIHFRFAVEDGIQQGEDIGRFVFTQALRPVDGDDEDEEIGIPAWVAHPEVLPAGHQGQSNCTFGSAGQWDAHPEGGCWEHPGPDGWTREQRNANHFESLGACGGGPGDAAQIRVCRVSDGDQVSPCNGNPTGPLGCAVCVSVVTCH